MGVREGVDGVLEVGRGFEGCGGGGGGEEGDGEREEVGGGGGGGVVVSGGGGGSAAAARGRHCGFAVRLGFEMERREADRFGGEFGKCE